ncbi:protein containing DUF309 [Sulfurimonas gotlandica GD1]|uniref:Protein containing DUF309 n=1 Tax=Sulfurimonas gotlandica (strain DSM 19862 / JCM 16533 / GD1) TaxID=929558 RepID=B6BH52_SULGG|nr:DUF309 domain-containing protein [Sulfurimonas gotlandica]EDZ63359.1 conserved hypothetical protein [Sulfurimonas gotlandica GD1]EHP29841.1 protein containing DUF309 [Sulfurimonas gotlandica GD1]
MNEQKHAEFLEEFIECLNSKRYYDAHEALEHIWFPRRFEDSDEIRLLKGFINASVSFELEMKGREESSKKVWKNYIKYRQLLYKVDSPHLNMYHSIARYIDSVKI